MGVKLAFYECYKCSYLLALLSVSDWSCLQTEAKFEKAWFICQIVRQYQFDSKVWFMRELSLLLGNVSDWPQIMATAR